MLYDQIRIGIGKIYKGELFHVFALLFYIIDYIMYRYFVKNLIPWLEPEFTLIVVIISSLVALCLIVVSGYYIINGSYTLIHISKTFKYTYLFVTVCFIMFIAALVFSFFLPVYEFYAFTISIISFIFYTCFMLEAITQVYVYYDQYEEAKKILKLKKLVRSVFVVGFIFSFFSRLVEKNLIIGIIIALFGGFFCIYAYLKYLFLLKRIKYHVVDTEYLMNGRR